MPVPHANQAARPGGGAVRLGIAGLGMIAALSVLASLRAGRRPGRRLSRDAGPPRRRAPDPGLPPPLPWTAHELRTPLSGLVAVLDALQHACTDARQQRLVELGQMAGAHLQRLLDGILDGTLADAEDEAFDLHALCRDAHGFWNESARAKGLRLDLALDASVPARVRGNPLRLRQVLFNLLANAVKFTERGGVTLRVHRQHNTDLVRLTVQDSGMGIAAAEQPRLFQPFRRTRAARRAGHAGTGLGLAISRELVQAMGGRIALRSRVGSGTCVTVDLPLPAAEDPAAAPPPPPAPDRAAVPGPGRLPPGIAESGADPAARQGRRILVAEDNPLARELIGLQLAQAGHAYDVAASGLDALRRLRTRQYGLLLTDVRMSGMNGAALARHVRRARLCNAQGSPLPVIALSADPPAQAGPVGRHPGFDGWLTKPIRQQDLAACLHRWLPPPRGREPD